jgi:hypothetical protein
VSVCVLSIFKAFDKNILRSLALSQSRHGHAPSFRFPGEDEERFIDTD